MGLRLGEGINLTVGDIDSTNMRVHIRNAKGNKDRLVPLPVNTLHLLKKFWKVHRHPHFIFPSRKRGVKNVHPVTMPLDRSGIQVAMKTIVTQLGIKKKSHAVPCVTALPCICLRPALISSNFRKS
jgi:integrase